MSTIKDPIGTKDGISPLMRPRFGPGMLLQHDDLEQLNSYTRDLSRLLFRSLFGPGVVCGLEISAVPKRNTLELTVGAGVAIGCSGDPIHVPAEKIFCLNEKFEPSLTQLWVVLCGTVKCSARRTATCSDDEHVPSVATRERDGFEIRVVQDPEPYCGDPTPEEYDVPKTDCLCANPAQPSHKDHYDGVYSGECCDCGCNCVILGLMVKTKNPEKPTDEWKIDYRVRRFIRPVLMRDPMVPMKEQEKQEPAVDNHDDDDPSDGIQEAIVGQQMARIAVPEVAEVVQQALAGADQVIVDEAQAAVANLQPAAAAEAPPKTPKKRAVKAPKAPSPQ